MTDHIPDTSKMPPQAHAAPPREGLLARARAEADAKESAEAADG